MRQDQSRKEKRLHEKEGQKETVERKLEYAKEGVETQKLSMRKIREAQVEDPAEKKQIEKLS